MRTVVVVVSLAGVVAVTAGTGLAQEAVPEEKEKPELERAIESLSPTGEIVVTATRTRRDPFELPQAIPVFDRDVVDQTGSFVALKATSRRHPAIWYDERTGTTTDLIIRGFAGFNLLTLVDGNPFSTLWGEGGFGADDMLGKIDPEVVERIEIASSCEIAVKYGLGKLTLHRPPDVYVPDARRRHGIAALPLSEGVCLKVHRLPPLHRDPFDRLLVSQALSEGMTILTPDPVLRQYPVATEW